MAILELPKEIKFINGPLEVNTEKACLCAGEFMRKIDGEVRSLFSPMIYVPVPEIEFDEEGVQLVSIIGSPELESWLSFLQGEQALRIRGPHHYIVSSELKDKGSITIVVAVTSLEEIACMPKGKKASNLSPSEHHDFVRIVADID